MQMRAHFVQIGAAVVEKQPPVADVGGDSKLQAGRK
jgi:hypothetical protein